MYKIQSFVDPKPYIIIDDFLEKRQAEQILAEAIRLEPAYVQADIKGLKPDACSCPDCKVIVNDAHNSIRDNEIVYLDPSYKDKRTNSAILRTFDMYLKDDDFCNIVASEGGMFPIINMVNSSETILSRYGKCDFYNWHYDNAVKGSERILTLVYYFNEEPERFSGGELLFGDYKNYLTIKPKHNRLLIFPSDVIHKVNRVDCPEDDWEGGRFSLNIWVGFNNIHRYR